MAAPVVSDHAEALAEEEQHLRVPIIGRHRPAVAKHDGLTSAPVLIENLNAVFGDRLHSNDRNALSSQRNSAVCQPFPGAAATGVNQIKC